jgi:hypothetical protein
LQFSTEFSNIDKRHDFQFGRDFVTKDIGIYSGHIFNSGQIYPILLHNIFDPIISSKAQCLHNQSFAELISEIEEKIGNKTDPFRRRDRPVVALQESLLFDDQKLSARLNIQPL